MGKNVLVAGAAGFIGTRVCKILKEKGYGVYALILPGSEIGHVENYVKEFIEGDLSNSSIAEFLLKKTLDQDITYIISLVGSVDYHHDYETSYRINVQTTVNITKLARGLHEKNKLQKYVYTGSVASRGFLKKKPGVNSIINEESDYYKKGISVYSDIKRECEDYVNGIIKSDDLDAVIVEPGSLIGEEIGNNATTNVGLIKKIIKGFPVLNGGASYTSVVCVARGIVSAMETGTRGSTYLLGGENLSMKEFALFVRSILEKEFPDAGGPAIPVIIIPGMISRFLGQMNLVINSQQALLGNSWHFIDSSRAKKELGYKHSVEDLYEPVKLVVKTIL